MARTLRRVILRNARPHPISISGHSLGAKYFSRRKEFRKGEEGSKNRCLPLKKSWSILRCGGRRAGRRREDLRPGPTATWDCLGRQQDSLVPYQYWSARSEFGHQGRQRDVGGSWGSSVGEEVQLHRRREEVQECWPMGGAPERHFSRSWARAPSIIVGGRDGTALGL